MKAPPRPRLGGKADLLVEHVLIAAVFLSLDRELLFWNPATLPGPDRQMPATSTTAKPGVLLACRLLKNSHDTKKVPYIERVARQQLLKGGTDGWEVRHNWPTVLGDPLRRAKVGGKQAIPRLS